MRRPFLPVPLTVTAVVATTFALGVMSGRAAPADTQTQTCPVLGNDPDPVTLKGPASLSPNHLFSSYGLSASETATEMGDGLPHGVTISFTVTTIDTPGGSSSTNPDASPSSGSAPGDFTTTTPFQLRGELPGTARTYQIDWTASFDGSNGVSAHTCSSTDGTHQPFRVTVVAPTPVVPETPLAIVLPIGGLVLGGGWLAYRRRNAVP